MTDKDKVSPLGEYVEPTEVRQLLHAAEFEYGQIRGQIHIDDSREIVDERLRAQTEFAEAPDSEFMNYLDLVAYMHRRTGLPFLLCVYYVFFLSESAGAIDWPEGFDTKSADSSRQASLKTDFASAVSQAVLGALLNRNEDWRAFNHELIGELLDQEDKRRSTDARRLYDAIIARD